MGIDHNPKKGSIMLKLSEKLTVRKPSSAHTSKSGNPYYRTLCEDLSGDVYELVTKNAYNKGDSVNLMIVTLRNQYAEYPSVGIRAADWSE